MSGYDKWYSGYKPERHGVKWRKPEISELIARWRKKWSIPQLALTHKRTEFAIECALEKYTTYIRSIRHKNMAPVNPDLIINGKNFTEIFTLASTMLHAKIELDARLEATALQDISNQVIKNMIFT